jgi:hypothetical protein
MGLFTVQPFKALYALSAVTFELARFPLCELSLKEVYVLN